MASGTAHQPSAAADAGLEPTGLRPTTQPRDSFLRTNVETQVIVSESDMKVYMAVGLALRWAQAFEAEMVAVVLAHGIARGRFRVRSEAEAFVERAEKKALRQLLRECLALVRFEPDVTGTFDAAVDARNFLAHSFFWERTEAFVDETRHIELLTELREMTDLFFSAHKFAEMLRNLYQRQFGSPEAL